MLACESNQALQQRCIDKVMSTGLRRMIPYVQSYKNSNSGATQSINIQFNKGNGTSLRKVYHSLYNNAETLDTAYDCSNNATLVDGTRNSTTDANMKVLQFYTQLNGKREQDLTINCNNQDLGGMPFSDYMYQKAALKGSVLANINVFQYNWFWCSDYQQLGAHADQDNNMELISGVPLGDSPLTWTFYGSSVISATYQHYTYAVFTKTMMIGPGVVGPSVP